MDPSETERRKEEHLRIPLEKDVQSIPNPWDAVHLVHEALPEIDENEVNLATTFLGQPLGAPIQITGMTGGAKRAKQFNNDLAAAAAAHNIAMGVGSQRAAIENPELADTYSVILNHDIPLRIANLGLPQLILWGDDATAHAETAIEMIDGHALAIHLNFLQEAVQPEGDTGAKGGLAAIARMASELNVPVVVKETGAGISGETAARIAATGVDAIDVGGLGGTSFSAVEYHRAIDQGDDVKARLGKTYWAWGNPTPQCIVEARATCPEMPLVATGGLRNGLDALRALHLGADMAGYAGAMFRAAADGPEKAVAEMGNLLEELKTGLYLSGLVRPPVGRNHS